MAYQKEYLQKVGNEGFQLIDECYGRSGRPVSRHPPPPREREGHYQHQNYCKYAYVEPQTHTVLIDPVSNSTTYVYHVQNQVPAEKQAYHATFPVSKKAFHSSNLMPATQHHGERNSYPVPHVARPKESVIKGNGPVTWFVSKVN